MYYKVVYIDTEENVMDNKSTKLSRGCMKTAFTEIGSIMRKVEGLGLPHVPE